MTNIKALMPQDVFQTERLQLSLLTKDDVTFVQELTNSKDWLRFIGDRGTTTIEGTEEYIKNVNDNPDCKFWKVSLKEKSTAIGIVTLIKREYLGNPDIGFAFLPQYVRKGFGFEATKVILEEAVKQRSVNGICGVTVEENVSSIHLLKKLGLKNHSTIVENKEKLEIYSMSIDELLSYKLGY